ncbi:LOW QUALITY PROTEIN: hypothetical protein MAR_023406 [Mya arenaria]|uniref:Transposase n=1 Tax=Mya arenaria TaxID=6604 RepID=A0ABY7DPJ8_MYAAR|nr:LOW QUALITY PROTEIN: hypothetical protein MAR_023406 [Mya arenaria]
MRQTLMAKRDPDARPVSFQTIHAGCRVKVPCSGEETRLTRPAYIHARLSFCNEHARLNREQWRTVLFSDESRFYLWNVDGRLRVWRRRRERHAHCAVIPTVAGKR